MNPRRRDERVAAADRFWGDPERPLPEVAPIRRSPDPGALPRSLGAPPLGEERALAQRHLEAVYDEAVRAATALAAANGLLDTSEADADAS